MGQGTRDNTALGSIVNCTARKVYIISVKDGLVLLELMWQVQKSWVKLLFSHMSGLKGMMYIQAEYSQCIIQNCEASYI